MFNIETLSFTFFSVCFTWKKLGNRESNCSLQQNIDESFIYLTWYIVSPKEMNDLYCSHVKGQINKQHIKQNLIGYVIKSCEAWRDSQKIWSDTLQVHIPCLLFNIVVNDLYLRFRKTSLKSSHRKNVFCFSIGS